MKAKCIDSEIVVNKFEDTEILYAFHDIDGTHSFGHGSGRSTQLITGAESLGAASGNDSTSDIRVERKLFEKLLEFDDQVDIQEIQGRVLQSDDCNVVNELEFQIIQFH